MSQREILFKAKRTDNGEWVEGWYCKETFGRWPVKPCIIPWENAENGYLEHVMVDGNTVCQYTGLNDKNGKKIFEGDILRISKKSDGMGGYYFPPLEYPVNVSVKFDLCAYMWETIGDEKYYISFPDAWCHYECEVIGNIHDN